MRFIPVDAGEGLHFPLVESGLMLELLDHYQDTDAERREICQAFDRYTVQLEHAVGHGDRNLVGKLEDAVAADPTGCFHFDGHGRARLRVAGHDLAAGRFACAALGSLRGQSAEGAKLRLWVLEGTGAATDIGALQAVAPPNSLFQVASQFNCLESPGPRLARVQDYFFDPTQGPRASISAYPGTLLRHYAAPGPDGQRFVQRDGGPQLNLLHRVALEGVARVEGGYLLSTNVKNAATFATLVQEHFDEIEVGVHEGVPVVLGAAWDGLVKGERFITQVFTSTVAGGGYSRVDLSDDHWLIILRQLQRAAYLGTLLAAARLEQERAVLTLIGGGVFGNPLPLIWDSILWACRQVGPLLRRDLTVIVNGRNLTQGVRAESLKQAARHRGGDLLYCGPRRASFELL